MTAEHDAVRARLGPVGVWSFAFDSLPADDVRRTAREIESLGYPSLWVPEGGGSREDLRAPVPAALRDRTDHGVLGDL